VFDRDFTTPGPAGVRLLRSNPLEVDGMQARDIMTRQVVTFWPDTLVRNAADVLIRRQIAAAPVVNPEDRLLGMVSEADLIGPWLPHHPRSHVGREETPWPGATQTVGEGMTTRVIAMFPTTEVAALAKAMFEYEVRSIPIVQGLTVVGIVSRRDLLKILIHDDNVIRAEVTTRLETFTGGQTRWDVRVHDGEVHIYSDVHDDVEVRTVLAIARMVPGVAHAELRSSRRPVAQASTADSMA
jgi:CBS domain-containing protein